MESLELDRVALQTYDADATDSTSGHEEEEESTDSTSGHEEEEESTDSTSGNGEEEESTNSTSGNGDDDATDSTNDQDDARGMAASSTPSSRLVMRDILMDANSTDPTAGDEFPPKGIKSDHVITSKLPASRIVVRDIAVNAGSLTTLPAESNAAFNQWLANSGLTPRT